MFTNPQYWHLPDEWATDLMSMGFVRDGRSQNFVLNGVVFTFHGGDWLLLKAKSPARKKDFLTDQMGKPGLWKVLKEGRRTCQLFEFYLSALTGTEGDLHVDPDEGRSPFRAVLNWAMQTLDGSHPDRWLSPPREELGALLPAGRLTVQSGAHARQGEVICEPNRLALRFPIVTSVPEGLSRKRQHWLRRLLSEAQNRWRMVRLGFIRDPSTVSVQAEVDLTGIPLETLPGLVEIALAALRCAVEWVLASAVFVADPGRTCRALDD